MLQVSLTTAILGHGFQLTLSSIFYPKISTSERIRLNAVSILCVRNIYLSAQILILAILFADFHRTGHRDVIGHQHIY